jgi:hypothetical protein
MRHFTDQNPSAQFDLKAIIDAALAVRTLGRTNDKFSASDFVELIADHYRGWTTEFVAALLDYAERERRLARRFRSWRKAQRQRRASERP